MKKTLAVMLLAAVSAAANPATNRHFLRQHQQTSNLVWDMPVSLVGQGPSALSMESGGALFQLWAINPIAPAREYLLDHKLVGVYLPKADIKVITLDPLARVPRTRVDQPFRVEIQISDLLTGAGLPLASSSVLLERHLVNYPAGQPLIDPVKAVSGTPVDSRYLSANGQHNMSFPVSRLTAPDPTKAAGEEHFVIHALADGQISQSQIASAMVQVLPVASGEIKGIASGDKLRFQVPKIELILKDLYPRSDTYLLLYDKNNEGVVVKSFPMDRDNTESHVLLVDELESKIKEDGDYKLVLVSDTVYGREELCDPVPFNIRRTIQMNAMQVTFSDKPAP